MVTSKLTSFPHTLEAFKKAVKVAKREIPDAAILSKILNSYLEVEKVLGRKN